MFNFFSKERKIERDLLKKYKTFSKQLKKELKRVKSVNRAEEAENRLNEALVGKKFLLVEGINEFSKEDDESPFYKAVVLGIRIDQRYCSFEISYKYNSQPYQFWLCLKHAYKHHGRTFFLFEHYDKMIEVLRSIETKDKKAERIKTYWDSLDKIANEILSKNELDKV